MVKVTAEKFEFSMRLNAVEVGSDKRLEALAVVWDARHCEEGLVQSIVGRYIEVLDAFINQVGTQLVDRFRAVLESTDTGCQVPCRCTLKHISCIRKTSVKVQAPTSHGGGERGAADANLSTPAPPKPFTPPAKGSRDRSKKACL